MRVFVVLLSKIKVTERILFELTNMGFTPVFAQKIMVLYKEKTMDIIKEDPYRVITVH